MRPTTRIARLATIAVIPAALLISGIAVSTASYSAFTATATEPSNNWSAGSLTLNNDDTANSPLFYATNLKPGSTGTNCIAVTSTGTLPSTIRLYGNNGRATPKFAPYLHLEIEEGTGGGYGTCNDFTPTSNSKIFDGSLYEFAHNRNYASGWTAWETAGGKTETRTFRITYTIDPNTPTTAMQAAATCDLVWEAQNT